MEPSVLLQTQLPYLFGSVVVLLFLIIGIAIRSVSVSRRLHADATREAERAQALAHGARLEAEATNRRLETQHTELSDAYRQLTEAHEALSEVHRLNLDLLEVLAHDLRQPLSVLHGMSEVVRDNDTGDDLPERFPDIVQQTCRRMLQQLDDMLVHARGRHGEGDSTHGLVDLRAIVEHVVMLYAWSAERKRQVLTCRTPLNLYVTGNGEQLAELVENLVSNAVKFTPHGAAIEVLLEHRDERAVLRVRDSGPGFTPEDRRMMFGRFQRLSARPTGEEGSTGLGLYIVQRIVQSHGGVVVVEDAPGGGAVFIVELPCVAGAGRDMSV